MQRFKYIIVSSAVALALTAANLSAQQSPSRPGGTAGGGGAGDASAANQSSQISLETKIATSAVSIATGMNALVQILQFTDGLEGLVTSGNALLSPIATSAVAVATGSNASRELLANIATHAFQSKEFLTRTATSAVAIATGIDASKELLLRIATSTVKIAQAGASTDTELPAAATPANGTGTPAAPGIYGYNLVYRSDQGRWYYGEAASSSTGVADGGTSRVVEASNSPVATSAVAIATSLDGMKAVQANIATAVVQMSSNIRNEQIACQSTIAFATTATNYRQVIPAGTGQIIYICSELWSVTQGALISFGYGGGTNCDSGPVDLTGEMSIAASSGAARGSGNGAIYDVPSGKAFCVRIATASGGAAIGGSLRYTRR